MLFNGSVVAFTQLSRKGLDVVHMLVLWFNFLATHSTTNIFFADVNFKKNLTSEAFKDIKSICILIGPEGDFSPAERESIFKNQAVIPFTLSKNILRSDTAVISAISLVNFINKFN